MSKIVYGDWIERKTVIKVVVSIREPDPGQISLSCDARMVSAPGDSVFEEDFKASKSVRKECQEMLNEIQATINQAPVTAPGSKPVTWNRSQSWPRMAAWRSVEVARSPARPRTEMNSIAKG
jgi:hypothetical protein